MKNWFLMQQHFSKEERMIYGKEYTRHEFAGLALSFYVCEHAKTKS